MTMTATFLKRRETLLFLIIALMVVAFSTRAPGFGNPRNLAVIFNDTAILIILALAQMTVVLTKAIDLSVAANLAFSGMAVAMLNAAVPGLPLVLLILLAIGIGAALGAINGFLVWRLEMPPIVVTLGTLTIYRGMAFVLSGGAWVNAHQMTPEFLNVPRLGIAGLPVLSWVAVIVVVLVFLMARYTPFGRSAYAAGGNPVAAVYAGIDVGYTRFLAFTLSGALAGLSGYLWVSRYAVAYVDIAIGFELDSVAACVIGGISIAGGVGTVIGTVLGALFLGVIKNALPVIGISPFTQMAISGSVIILAVVFNARRERHRGRIILRNREAEDNSSGKAGKEALA
ncbi:ABC transporter permease [Rhizobium sp. NFR03]|uniref:ABC transporter permease n=1 Tax=Rhizobium sp. NFR03 TaxID=1566263 RepID=UPI0008C003DD|nr:ABC transporter permease [Rhizobium sp. NFR03]SER80014.1 rhamnose transport system permease protein [Rhizobium sp. NFR03]